jgi:hypothetical protein
MRGQWKTRKKEVQQAPRQHQNRRGHRLFLATATSASLPSLSRAIPASSHSPRVLSRQVPDSHCLSRAARVLSRQASSSLRPRVLARSPNPAPFSFLFSWEQLFFDLEKYDFDLYKGFFVEKNMAQTRQIFMIKEIQIARFL